AKHILQTTPIARPVIYTLAGCRPGERCVIERTETEHLTRTDETSAANDWLVRRASWEARVGGNQLFTAGPTEVGGNSRLRREALSAWTAAFGNGFDWVTPPVLNPFTRIAVEMCAAEGVLRVAGYEKLLEVDLPVRVTQTREITAYAGDQRERVAAAS